MHTANVIDIQNVRMEYQSTKNQAVIALEDVNLQIPEGEFISIVGPSGCGKSTLLKLIAGQVTPTGGTVSVTPQDSAASNALGIVFQQPLLLPWRTVASNIALSEDFKRTRSDKEKEKEIARITSLLGLEGFEKHYPWQLSGGMQQRVGIGRALMYDPHILMMDEPFGALDAMTRDQIGMDLLDIWEANRKTVLFITHSIQEAVMLSDRVVVMSARPGRILEIIDIDIERPRTFEQIASEEFGEYALRIRTILDAS